MKLRWTIALLSVSLAAALTVLTLYLTLQGYYHIIF